MTRPATREPRHRIRPVAPAVKGTAVARRPATHALVRVPGGRRRTGGPLFLFWVVGLAALCLAGPVAAQEGGYRVGPKDVLQLVIFAGGEKQTDVNLTVSAEGSINVPFLGPLQIGGLTVSQIEDRVREPLAADYFVNPEINVSVREYHSHYYNIAGAIRNPGMYETMAETTLLELIAKAGGVTLERGSLAFVIRDEKPPGAAGQAVDLDRLVAQQEPIRVDLTKLLDEGDTGHNLLLEPGDLVYIPLEKSQNPGESKVYLEGEIRTGVIDYRPGLTALNACIIAGGFNKYAAPNRTRIYRKKGDEIEVIKINLEDVQDGKAPDFPLRPGDRIYIPQAWF